MYKVYCGKIFEKKQIIELLSPNLSGPRWGLWDEKLPTLSERVVEVVSVPEEADFFLLPHNYNHLLNEGEHVTFFPGDSDAHLQFSNAVVFRNSQYKSRLLPNEIILPGYVEDLGSGGISPKLKEVSETPTVGFCGWADFKTIKHRLISMVKVGISTLQYFLGDKESLVRRKGIWWRIKLLRILAKSNKVKSNFIIRKSYSGSQKTIELSPEQARKEYVENIIQSDFTLCVKGDGNFSTRFFETISLGRIPLFIDTDCPLPLDGTIDYSKFIFRVDYKNIKELPELLTDFYRNLSEEQFVVMQKQARETFEKYLRIDSFLQYVFTPDFIG
ncbi:MAG: hypothetical protein UT49_C0005G0001, partial [Parcubacteria group bacterium GW2011_GWF1_39_37]